MQGAIRLDGGVLSSYTACPETERFKQPDCGSLQVCMGYVMKLGPLFVQCRLSISPDFGRCETT